MKQKKFIVRTVSGNGSSDQKFDTKNEALAVISGHRNIQKVAPRIWVIVVNKK